METVTQQETRSEETRSASANAAAGTGPAPAAVPSVVRGLRAVRMALWALLAVAILGVLGLKLLTPRTSNLPVLFPAARFALTDQNGQPFSSDNLRGRPWIGAFVFTHCADVCPRMTSTMSGLQKQLPPGVQLVSFSVDPERDTPAELKGYAAAYHADESRWHFLTGPKDRVLDVIGVMKLAFAPAERGSPILHSEKLLLVDADGLVRGDYHSNDPDDLKRLATDAAALEKDATRGPVGKWLARHLAGSGPVGGVRP